MLFHMNPSLTKPNQSLLTLSLPPPALLLPAAVSEADDDDALLLPPPLTELSLEAELDESSFLAKGMEEARP